MKSFFQKVSGSPLYPFVAPFVLFSIFLMIEGLHPLAVYVVYPIKTFAVGALILVLLSRLPAIEVRSWIGSIFVGAIAFVLWVGLDPYWVKHEAQGGHSGFNPYIFGAGEMAWGLMAFRVLGASLVVPVMEELFWRGFLMRYLIQENFESIPLGKFQWISFVATTAMFASVHGAQWSLAVVVGILYGGWFLKTKTLGDVMVAHGVTNLMLGAYVISTGKWYFW